MCCRCLGLLSLCRFIMPKPLVTAKLPKTDDFCRVHLNQTLLCRSKNKCFYAPAIGASTSSFSTLLANSCHPLRNLNIPCGGFNIPCESFNIPCEGYNIPCEIPVIIPCGNSAVRAKCQKILESSAYTSYACSVFILHYRLFQLISPINSFKNLNITIILVYNFRLIYYPVLFP